MKSLTRFEVENGFGGMSELKGVTSWEQVTGALYERGIVNKGKVRVHKLEYNLICTTPQLVDTTYKGGDV
jgi:hypothetical protein